MTMTSPRPKHTNGAVTAKLAVIEQTYPAWRIRPRRNNMWTATRVTDPTPQQAAAGLHQCIIQPTLDALAAVLCQQLKIDQTVGRF